jgi:hypothetical protein
VSPTEQMFGNRAPLITGRSSNQYRDPSHER